MRNTPTKILMKSEIGNTRITEYLQRIYMITLKKLPFTDGIDSVATLFGYDTKANL